MMTPDPARDRSSSQPGVSVIVPARNEEASLAACLESLVSQPGVNFEIIVVDDGSTDRTLEIAQSFSGVKVIQPGPLRANWTGKNNAVFAGSQQARGEWLLFTDADTVHISGSLARALAEANQHGASLLSYSPEQEVHGFWEKAIMPVIFAELAAAYSPSDVCDQSSPAAAANGQYILISHEAYAAVGGHAAVATSLLEDVELARLVKSSGRKIFFRYGGDAVRTRMYRNFAQLREGWTKNLALLFPSPFRLAITRFAEFLLIVGVIALAIVAATSNHLGVAGVAVALASLALAFLFRRIRRAHFDWEANALSLFGLPLFSYLLLRSKLSYKRNKVSWKGRNYATTRRVSTGESGKLRAGTATQSSASIVQH
jgi:glycosyltransferase involved in cell wall biosynthesis